MSIIIYTYSNPYKLDKELYWEMIQNSFHLCVSQTLVNGLCDKYDKSFYKGKLVTVKDFLNNMYDNWESDVTNINQRVAIDNIISYMDFEDIFEESSLDINDVVFSLKRNRIHIIKSIRLLFELGISPDKVPLENITLEQKVLLKIMEELIRTRNKNFYLQEEFSEKELDNAIEKTIKEKISCEREKEIKSINKDTIVIHGIHQFTPIMLRMIEKLSMYKNVILLFNYQSDYKNVYQTWINIYSWFESKINISSFNWNENNNKFEGSKIASNLAAIISGNTKSIDFSNKLEVIEFDNQTEFAGYIARKFERADKLRKENGYVHSALYYMQEQIYSANTNINEILKIYFPDQFGERDFLNYPIGHFFIAVTNMWNPETKSMEIQDISDVIECLSCGIIQEKRHGAARSTLEKCKLYVEKETTLKKIIKKLKRLKLKIENLNENELQEFSKVEYFNVNTEEIGNLIEALKELNSISEYFFKDFNDDKNDFKKFYSKISDLLISKIIDREDIEDDFKRLVERVLTRLDDVKEIDANASYDCLRETMQLYLQQLPLDKNGAEWIVRGFEQIDGDALKSQSSKIEKTYHFSCLSDQDMSITHQDEFPWPLDMNFFEYTQAPDDWKYQVFITSRDEYKNFRRYALIYGLAFCNCKLKLSYIKNDSGTEKELYYLLKILGATIRPYSEVIDCTQEKDDSYINLRENNYAKFSQYDLMKYRLCSYKFLLESATEGTAIYKDEYLIKKYVTAMLENRVSKYFSEKTYVKGMVISYIDEQIDDIISSFPFITITDAIDIENKVCEYIEHFIVHAGKFDKFNIESGNVARRIEFLNSEYDKNDVFKSSTQDEIDYVLNDINLSENKFKSKLNKYCDLCANKDVCLEIFKIDKRR